MGFEGFIKWFEGYIEFFRNGNILEYVDFFEELFYSFYYFFKVGYDLKILDISI